MDRSRGNRDGGPAYGENAFQREYPDDLYLLRLLNEWSDLAAAAHPPGALLRLLGNHEVFVHSLEQYASEQSARLLYDHVEQHIGAPDIYANRLASFTAPFGAYHQAVWYHRTVRLLVQIGTFLFAHASITPQTIAHMQLLGDDPDSMMETVRGFVLGLQKQLPAGISDVLQDRKLSADTKKAGQRTERVLQQWSTLFPRHRPARTLIVGHTVQFPDFLAPEDRVHGTAIGTLRNGAQEFGPPLRRPARGLPWINAAVNAAGEPVLWRIDAGQSRAWWTSLTKAEAHIVPQVLRLDPRRGSVTTIMSGTAFA